MMPRSPARTPPFATSSTRSTSRASRPPSSTRRASSTSRAPVRKTSSSASPAPPWWRARRCADPVRNRRRQHGRDRCRQTAVNDNDALGFVGTDATTTPVTVRTSPRQSARTSSSSTTTCARRSTNWPRIRLQRRQPAGGDKVSIVSSTRRPARTRRSWTSRARRSPPTTSAFPRPPTRRSRLHELPERRRSDQGDRALTGALTSLKSLSSSLGANLSVAQTRQDFTKDLADVLTTGASNLVNADANEEAANLLSLQTRQQLSQTALSMSSPVRPGASCVCSDPSSAEAASP